MKALKNKFKDLPSLRTDLEAENFINSDLTEFDLSNGVKIKFEIEQQEKNKLISLRLPSELLNLLKAKTKNNGIPYTKYIRYLLEQDLLFSKT